MVRVLGWVVGVFVVVVSVFYIWFDIAHRNIPQLIVWCIVLAAYTAAMIVKARRVRRGKRS